MRKLGAAALLASLIAATPALAANQLDLSKVSCKDFLGSGKDNISIIITWLDAYYLGEKAPPIIDFDRMAKTGAGLGKYCAENGDAMLSKAADTVMGK
ncbi:MAG TPA: HdeA/HdeB family chaperone [Stellaceae bacterium]|nr:HdeA/HdeB family chaperone [Stellaceae bacterium]